MRWPFFFGRGSATIASRGPEPRAPIRDWATLPAIQRVAGEPQLTAATPAFVHSLAGTHDPDLSLEPLGHHVSLDAPPGLVSGLARNVETYAPSHELVALSRARREAPVQRRLVDSEEAAAAPAAPEELVAEPVAMSFAVVDEPVQARPPLTRLADSEAGAVIRLAMPRPPAETTPAQLHEAPTAEAATQIGPGTVTAQRLTLGQSRRIGLGAPISKPAGATLQRSAEATPLDLAPSPRASAEQHIDDASRPDIPLGHAEGGEPASAAVERIAPIVGATIQRRAAPEAGDGEPYADLPLARGAGTGAVEAASPPERALIQRVVATPLPPLFSRPAQVPTAPILPGRPPLLTVRRTADSGEAGSGEGGEAAGPVAIQRLLAIAPGESPVPFPQPDLRQVVTPAAYREVVAAATPSPRSAPPLAPAVQRLSPAVQDFVAYSPFATTSVAPSGQRTTTLINLPVQREVTAGEATEPESGVASAPAATAAGAGAAAAEGPAQSDKELDELARKLHDRISRHIRRDLLIQRERAGMVTDLR